MYIIAAYYKAESSTTLTNTSGMAHWITPYVAGTYTHISYTAMNNCRNVVRYYTCSGNSIKVYNAEINWGSGSHETNNTYNVPGFIYGFNV